MRVPSRLRTTGLICAIGAVIAPGPVFGQTTIAPIVAGDDPEYEIDPIPIGPVRVSPRIIANLNFDDNVLASPEGTEIEDVEFIVRPELEARYGDNNVRFELAGFGEFSRFADFTSENSDTYGVTGAFSYSPQGGSRFDVDAGYARLKENRSDPEARDLAGPGPRLIDSTFANARYRNQGGRILLNLQATFNDLDAIAPFDDERDFKTYAGRATVGYRVSGPIYATVTGFANVRDFRLEGTPIDPDRDATTYGGQIGVTVIASGRIRGRARIGAFRFEPDDPRLEARTGFSVDTSIIYQPTRRSAVILEAFRGDVATFRRGAEARTDTSVALVGQFEIRHNLFARANVRWIENRFVGGGITEDTFGSGLALEFIANRRLSLIGQVSAAQRTSDDPTQEFDKFQAAVTARIRF
ncbi:MAG: outer membrane beta-barrel protein [Erythrobacter sp.]|uniref:outer membrane beta-barrel protein n=1 Tax=Erythrobacter sp. TaxID=1042 RepID=UPI003C737578